MYPCNPWLIQVFDFDWFDGLGQLESKNSRVEVKLRVESLLDVLCLPEAVLFAGKGDVRNRNSLRSDRLNHRLRLVRRDNLVFKALKKYHRTRQPFGKVDRRTLVIDVLALGICA